MLPRDAGTKPTSTRNCVKWDCNTQTLNVVLSSIITQTVSLLARHWLAMHWRV